MKKISITLLSVFLVGSNMVIPTGTSFSSIAGISTAEAARGARVTRSGARGSVSRSAVAGPRGGAARTTVRTPYGSASRSVAVTRPVHGRPIPPPPARVHARSRHYNNYHDNYYSGGTVLAAAVAGLAIGAMVASVPPSCTTVYANGIEYKNCGGTYYQQTFRGPDVVYVVVPAL
jgi:hypothetical protein